MCFFFSSVNPYGVLNARDGETGPVLYPTPFSRWVFLFFTDDENLFSSILSFCDVLATILPSDLSLSPPHGDSSSIVIGNNTKTGSVPPTHTHTLSHTQKTIQLTLEHGELENLGPVSHDNLSSRTCLLFCFCACKRAIDRTKVGTVTG